MISFLSGADVRTIETASPGLSDVMKRAVSIPQRELFRSLILQIIAAGNTEAVRTVRQAFERQIQEGDGLPERPMKNDTWAEYEKPLKNSDIELDEQNAA